MELNSTLFFLCISVYHLVNVYTDVKYRITKNVWHLLFFLGASIYMFTIGFALLHYLSVFILALIFGLILEQFKITYAGDTKMCVVSALWLGIAFPNSIPYITVLGLYVFYLLVILLISYLIVSWKKGVIWTIKNQVQNIKAMILRTPLVSEKVLNRFPGAVAIAIGTFIQALYLNW